MTTIVFDLDGTANERRTEWPDLPLAAWGETCDTLQLWTQIVGKVRIALTPLVNHWWNATLFVTARGLAAPAMPYDGRTFDVIFDLTALSWETVELEVGVVRSRKFSANIPNLEPGIGFLDGALIQAAP